MDTTITPPPFHAPANNSELMRRAKESLKGNWGACIGATLIYIVITIITIAIPIADIIGLVIEGPITLGFAMLYLNMIRKKSAEVEQIFAGFKHFTPSFCLYILILIFILLWSLLFIIPGIVALFAYSMSFYILADNPGIGALEAIRRSKQMMKGRKGELFCLCLRFLGWFLVCCFFVIGFLWLIPYMYTACAHFYEEAKKSVTPDADQPTLSVSNA